MILVRDLNDLQFKKGLNDTEQRAYNTIVRRFLQEWTLSKDIQIKEAKKKTKSIPARKPHKRKTKTSSGLIPAVIGSKKRSYREKNHFY